MYSIVDTVNFKFFVQLIVLLNDKPQNLLFYFSSSEFKQQCFLEILLNKKKNFLSPSDAIVYYKFAIPFINYCLSVLYYETLLHAKPCIKSEIK